MVGLNSLENRALRLKALYGDEHGLTGRRHRVALDRELYGLGEKASGLVGRYIRRKGLQDNHDDAKQHALMAIDRAIQTWDPAISKFSTYFTWRLRAEFGALEHRLYPERRRIEVDHPIVHIELDGPIMKGDGQPGSRLVDTIEDEDARQDIEDSASNSQTMLMVERVWSHYIAGEMLKFCRSHKDLGRIKDKRIQLMRMRHIHKLSTFDDMTNAAVSAIFGITRERVRQLDAKVNQILRDRLPRYDSDIGEIIEPLHPIPTDVHQCWPAMLAEFNAYLRSSHGGEDKSQSSDAPQIELDKSAASVLEKKAALAVYETRIIEMDLPTNGRPFDFVAYQKAIAEAAEAAAEAAVAQTEELSKAPQTVASSEIVIDVEMIADSEVGSAVPQVTIEIVKPAPAARKSRKPAPQNSQPSAIILSLEPDRPKAIPAQHVIGARAGAMLTSLRAKAA